MSGRPCLQSDVHVQGPLLSEAIFLSISHKLAKSLQARAWKDVAKRVWKAWQREADAAGAGMEDTIKLFFQVQALSKAFSKVKQPWLMFASYSKHHNLLGTTG